MPSNISFATATLIPSFPYDFTQTDINSGATNSTVFYRFIAPVGAVVMGGWCFSGNISTGYRPTTYTYLGPAGAPTDVPPYDGINAQNKPFQMPVTPGLEYFLEIRKNTDDSVPTNQVRVQLEVFSALAVANGDIVVNDDTPGFPLAVLSPTTDYLVKSFYKDIAAGEDGDILTSGISALNDWNSTEIRVYNPNFSLVGIANYSSGVAHIRACKPLNKFFVGFETNPVTVRTVNPDATYGATTWTLTGMNGCLGFAANNDGSKFYLTQHAGSVPIRVWDVGTLAFVADLYPGTSGVTITDILVLSDDSIVAVFESTAVGTVGLVTIRRFNAAGTVLNTYSPGTNSRPGGSFARLAYSLNEPASFWVWMHENNGISRFNEIRISDGVIVTTRVFSEYETGILQATATATPLSRYGPSFSCPFFIMRGVAPPSTTEVYVTQVVVDVLTKSADFSGVYFINPPKVGRFDTYYDGSTTPAGTYDVKIPDPTIKTALIGE
jgi:hypothetical protein